MKKINITIKNTLDDLDKQSNGLDVGPDPLSEWVFRLTALPGACNGYTLKKCSSRRKYFRLPLGGWSSSSSRRNHTLHIAERVPKVSRKARASVTALVAPGVQGKRYMMSQTAGIKLNIDRDHRRDCNCDEDTTTIVMTTTVDWIRLLRAAA
jgi:hypothetical protein